MATKPTAKVVAFPFKWVFLAIVAVFLLTFISSFYLASLPTPTKAQEFLLDKMNDGWKTCLGAFLGLLGGRASEG